MHSETNPVQVLFAASQCLEGFADFWRGRVEIEEAYLDKLSELRIPNPPGDGQLQELAQKTRELLHDELEERRRGFAKLKAAYKSLEDIVTLEEGTSYFDQWARAMKPSLLRISSLAAEIATAECTLAVDVRDESYSLCSSAEKERQPRSNVLSRLLNKARTEQPELHHDTPHILSPDSAYRQKVQEINDEKYMVRNEIVPHAVRYVKQNTECIVAIKHIVSTFSAVHSDLAQVLNNTSSELCRALNSVDASAESTAFAGRLNESFASLIQPYRYTSYEISSSFRPTTMLFGCALPDDLGSASNGQRAVVKAFETILCSAAEKHPQSLYQAICDAHKRQGNDVKQSALELESLWDPSQEHGGLAAVEYLANGPSDRLLVYFLSRLPEPFLPLQDADIKSLTKMDANIRNLTKWDITPVYPVTRIFGKAGNRMGTARRYTLARLFLTLKYHQQDLPPLVGSSPEGFHILTRATDLLPHSRVAAHFSTAIQNFDKIINQTFGDSLILPGDCIEELKRAGLL